MGHPARIAVAATAFLACACGDPLVVIGDFPGTFRIIAGLPDSAGAELGETSTASQLNTPLGIVSGTGDVIYIADHANQRIVSVTPSGAIDVILDGASGAEPRPHGPDGLAVDGAGSLLIADRSSHRIWRLNLTTGGFEPIAGNGSRGTGPDTANALEVPLETPTGIAVDPEGFVYFSEFYAHRIRRLDPDGRLVTVAGSRFPGFSGDGGPAIDASFRSPAGLALSNGVLYIADSGNHRIRAIDLPTGTIQTVAGSGTVGFAGDGGAAVDALLDTPLDVAASSQVAVLFIADTGNQRIRAVNLQTQVISTFAGTGDEMFNGDLLAAGETALSAPSGIAVSSLGQLYVSDTGHHIVRRAAVSLLTAR
jgi:DNA-binding beta-propeller fold protein YncE